MKIFKKINKNYLRFNNNQLQIDSFIEKIIISRKKVRVVFDKIKENKSINYKNQDLFDDLYEEARESVQNLFDEYKEIKMSLPEEQINKYKEELKDLQKKMDILWNTLYMVNFEKYDQKKSFWGTH